MLVNNFFHKQHNSKDKNINKMIDILPGLIMCIVLAYTGKFIGKFIPSLGGACIAIFLGIGAGNTFATNKIYAKGSKFAESNLLSYSIVLLGATLSAETIIQLGYKGVGFIIIQMFITIVSALFIGKKLGFSENFRFLMASGNAVCGSSAIAATAPVIDANDNDKGISITMVNITGTVLMLLLPFIAKLIFHLEPLKTSALIGGVLQSMGQVVASGSLINEHVKDLATVFKIVRIIFLVFVVLSFGTIKKRSCNKTTTLNSNSKVSIPWYVLGFFIMCFLFTTGIVSPTASKLCKSISNNFEIIALAGIGMRVNLKELIKQGAKVSIYAIGIASVQILCALTLISIFF